MVKVRVKKSASPGISSRETGRVHYSRVFRGIESSQTTVWLVLLPSGKQHLLVWYAGARFEDVHTACKIYYPGGFKLRNVHVGEYEVTVKKILHEMSMDSRFVDQDGYVHSGLDLADPTYDPFADS